MRKEIKNVPKDKSIFKHTAVTVKSINLGNVVRRGGIRF